MTTSPAEKIGELNLVVLVGRAYLRGRHDVAEGTHSTHPEELLKELMKEPAKENG